MNLINFKLMGISQDNLLYKIKSTNILRTVFLFIRNNKKLNIIKYNKKLKKILGINFCDYKNLIIIELILTEEILNISLIKKMKFINFDKNIDLKTVLKSGYIDIYSFKHGIKKYINDNYLSEKK